MKRHFHTVIYAVCFRRRVQHTLHFAAWGLFVAALVLPISLFFAIMLFCISVFVGLFFTPAAYTYSSAAQLIDQHYRLKDRILTAFSLLRSPSPTPMEQLQIADAVEYLPIVKPRAMLPIRLPKTLWIALAILAGDCAFMTLLEQGFFSTIGKTGAAIDLLPIDQAILREDIVEESEKIVQELTGEPALENLPEELKMLLNKFDGVKMDAKESLATLSEMNEALQSALDSLQLETMEELLQELAQTLELSEQTLPISKALKRGDYSQAASDLKKFAQDMSATLSKMERETIAKEMQTLAEHAEKRSQQPLQQAAQQMSDALQKEDPASAQEAADALASEMEKHSIRQGIGKDLANKQMQLGMMKADSGLAMSGGKNIAKSKSASETWGSGSAGNPNAGQETNLQGERQQETLTGMLGEQGDSLKETIDSQETASATSQQGYREQFQQYERISEAVLDNEPIPMGQRQMIRRYFESIRPREE